MQLRTRLATSSPVKQNENISQSKKVEESSDWSLTSPVSDKSSDISPRRVSSRSALVLTSSSSASVSPVKNVKLSKNDKIHLIPSMESDLTEDEKESIPIPVKSKNFKRQIVVDDVEDGMIDIMTDTDTETVQGKAEIIDSNLNGLLEDDEIDMKDATIDDSDRKLYEMAFNKAEMTTSSSIGNHSGSDGIFKGNHLKLMYKTGSATSGGRGKGKDLFNVLKQRARGPKIPSIRKIYFGTDVAINPWYSAPYPSEYHSESGELWICEFCLQYMKNPYTAQRHLLKCHGCLPPGDEIYRDPVAGISVFEINGRESKLYCQNLCLLAKMFLDHKTLYYDVDPFLFYVLIEWKALGTGRFLYSFVGYFSKEKINPAGFNVSCILTMPHHQRKGYGSFLIDFSYLLSRKEGRLGTPEKPLSDLGLFSYVSYWKSRLLAHFSDLLPKDLNDKTVRVPIPTLAQISEATGMTENDILSTLEYLRMLRFDIITLNPAEPTRQTLQASILIDIATIDAYRTKIASRPQLVAHEEYLRWHPYKCTK